MDHHTVYARHADAAYGRYYAACVGRFQEGFLKDRVCRDIDAAFERAVEVCEASIVAIKMRGEMAA